MKLNQKEHELISKTCADFVGETADRVDLSIRKRRGAQDDSGVMIFDANIYQVRSTKILGYAVVFAEKNAETGRLTQAKVFGGKFTETGEIK